MVTRRLLVSLPTSFAVLTMALLPVAAFAHPGHGFTASLAGGLQHPLSGIDHLLAMVAVGIWAAQLGGRARWCVPAAFVTLMIAGGVFGAAGVALPASEAAIATSVLVLGVLVAAFVRVPLPGAMMLVGVFALFHGYAHGAEMPEHAGMSSYVAGFVLATALLLGLGLGLGALGSRARPWVLRLVGAGIALAGVALFA